jgi:methionyl aminopeptidase
MRPARSKSDVAAIRAACQVAASVLDSVCAAVAVGTNTYDLDQLGRTLIAAAGAESACHNYRIGARTYPAHICLSVNDEVVHGIGSLRRVLRDGDVLSVDVVVRYHGWIGDNARTVVVGTASPTATALLSATEESLYRAIDRARPGNRVGDISHAVESFVRQQGLGIVRDFVGHGVGRSMHESPQIPNFGPRTRGEVLRPGMTLAIEPMITAGRGEVMIDDDGWTARTRDGSLSAHFEHTVLVTAGDPEILTIPPGKALEELRLYSLPRKA